MRMLHIGRAKKNPFFLPLLAQQCGLIPQHVFIAAESRSCLHLKSCQQPENHTHPHFSAAIGIMFDTTVICQIHLL